MMRFHQGTEQGSTMATSVSAIEQTGQGSGIRGRLFAVYGFLAALTIVAWALLLFVGQAYPSMIGVGALAYTLGLRHAIDADHIAAIDNTTRKLMQEGKRPVAVGLFFSLGHSTVVIALSVLIAITVSVVAHIETAGEIGGLIGTTVSATFLIVIGLINLVALIEIFRMFRTVTRGGTYSDQTLDDFLANRGILARIFRPMLRLVRQSWHMYPVGLLFGLGFDTATQVGLLGVSATASGAGIPIAAILVLPLLFTAGMSLVDTTDGVLMLGAYGWAFIKPIRKLYYNMTITFISVVIALVIGGIEVLSIIGDRFSLTGGIWDFVGELDFQVIGIVIIATFVLSWVISTVIYKVKGYDRLEPDHAEVGPPV